MDGNMFLFVETQETKALLTFQEWLPAALKCDNWETGSHVWMALAISADAVELELEKRAREIGYID